MKGPKRLYCYDSRVAWLEPPLAAARARGWDAVKLGLYDQPREPGYTLVNVHADPAFLPADRELAHRVARLGLRLVTDLGQVDVYERKREQWRRWGELMPDTWVVEDRDVALRRCEVGNSDGWFPLPLVSKADVGASSYNVRIIRDRGELRRHAEAAFTPPGIPVKCCAGEREQAYQLGYVLLQEFVPHETTYRVNRVGDAFAVFHRFNHPTKGTAQTGNVEPVAEVNDETADLLAYAERITDEAIRSKWVALDILKHPERGWLLLETSLRFPHPGARNCDEVARWFQRDTTSQWAPGKTFGEMWDVLIDQLEAGAFDDD